MKKILGLQLLTLIGMIILACTEAVFVTRFIWIVTAALMGFNIGINFSNK